MPALRINSCPLSAAAKPLVTANSEIIQFLFHSQNKLNRNDLAIEKAARRPFTIGSPPVH